MQKLRRNFSPTAAPINNADCNCGSYALNLLDWFTPFERSEADEEDDWDERFQHIVDVHSVTKSKAHAIFKALIISSSVASGFITRRFSAIVPENIVLS